MPNNDRFDWIKMEGWENEQWTNHNNIRSSELLDIFYYGISLGIMNKGGKTMKKCKAFERQSKYGCHGCKVSDSPTDCKGDMDDCDLVMPEDYEDW